MKAIKVEEIEEMINTKTHEIEVMSNALDQYNKTGISNLPKEITLERFKEKLRDKKKQ